MPSVVVLRPVTRRTASASASRWCGPARRTRVPSISKRTSMGNRTIMRVNENKFRVGLVQMSCTTDTAENLDRASAKIREAAARGAQIVCLQELFRSQYFCRVEDAHLFDLAESIPGPSTNVLGPLAKELGVVIVASLFER